MKRIWWMAVASVLGGVAGVAAERFSEALAPSDFVSAGLQRLSQAELAQLDRLVGEFRRGELMAAQQEAERAQAAAAEGARREAETGSQLARDKRRLTVAPGTDIEYGTIESALAGEFRGWEAGTTFELANGQRWRAAGSNSYVTPPLQQPAVRIEAGFLGSFWMSIEGVKPRVKVTPVSVPR